VFPALFQSSRVRLRAIIPEDLAHFARWSADADYMRLLDDDPIRPQSASFFAHMSAHGEDQHHFGVEALPEELMIGFVALFNVKWRNQTADMAMGIGEASYRGKGYGSAALRLLLDYAFHELNLYRVGLSVLSYNAPAIRAYERAGFSHEGTRRGMALRAGQRHDMLQYGILREAYTAQHG
jgi:RimJ/RimL family protein N-acetyltransferase